MAAITRPIWVPPRAGRRVSSCTASILDGLPERTTPTRTIKRVADSLPVDPRLPSLFQGVREQAQSEKKYGEIPWQPRLVEGGRKLLRIETAVRTRTPLEAALSHRLEGVKVCSPTPKY